LQKTNQLFDSFLAESIPDHVYICGPEEMIHSVKDAMLTKGVKLENIHFELFTTSAVEAKKPVEADNAPKVESNVSVIIDGDTFKLHLESNGENILDAASKTGADLPFACKGGVCCTCKAKILEGSASMDVNYALEADEVEAGYILTCQAHPTSDKLVVSFDD
ncbi:MAG: 2Fe-2S iron-sulfur cluster-binding protein, partial [Crocinitomicaceae bacterium]|nr:2Fe-2S iron-sulfur cluster-binding protein [Crocinitomicaceae bacterium]